ncbi:YybH family protein [Alteromonas sp. H39]|uniref:YybH family protein n=1 Tax=Alteromonas sp. H39 TaxID=3389876 RepID=UPI0039DFE5ED
MKVHASVIMILLLIFSAPGMAANAEKGEVAKAIHAVNDRFMQAWQAGDAQKVASLYTKDAVFMVPGMAPLEGRQAIQDYIQNGMDAGLTGIALTPREIQSHGSNAHEIGTYTLTTAEGNVADKGNYVVIWKRVNGKWYLRRDITNSTMAASH